MLVKQCMYIYIHTYVCVCVIQDLHFDGFRPPAITRCQSWMASPHTGLSWDVHHHGCCRQATASSLAWVSFPWAAALRIESFMDGEGHAFLLWPCYLFWPYHISIYLSIYLSIYPSIYLSTYLSIYLSVYPSYLILSYLILSYLTYLSACLPACLSVYLSIFLSISVKRCGL